MKKVSVTFDKILIGQTFFENESEKLNSNSEINFNVGKKCVSIKENS